MQGLIRKSFSILLDPRAIVCLLGVTLSVVMHEAFHVIIHWGEIQSFSIFPDHNAIVEILFIPSKGDVDLAFEEATAYLITIITLVLTVMLMSDIHEARDKRSVQQILLPRGGSRSYSDAQKKKLNKLLGIKNPVRKTSTASKRK